ncbi:MAG TPA: ATP-binding protein [Pyrinomonadaceae bacterium]|nr:ATP-binding protein [Pyrinomonadaceae bacterium]
MQRRILIVDDHDDLSSALSEVFSKTGYFVKTTENRDDAVRLDLSGDYDVVISDLDGENAFSENGENQADIDCLPEPTGDITNRSHVKAFKVCAKNFRREEFNEEELKHLFETVLNYKAQFVDKTNAVKQIREMIEFEFPSAISLMHAILEYLMKRVEKVGVVNTENSNLFIALDEAFVNAVKHGNKFDANKIVRITAEVSTKEARFTIEDEGDGFDVAAIPDPRNPENLFKTSGRGVLIIHNVMDEVTYNERGNRLTMIKRNEKHQEI